MVVVARDSTDVVPSNVNSCVYICGFGFENFVAAPWLSIVNIMEIHNGFILQNIDGVAVLDGVVLCRFEDELSGKVVEDSICCKYYPFQRTNEQNWLLRPFF